MFKKAKLYSLLAIIVASTVVGLFGSQQTISAQASDSAWEDQRMIDSVRAHGIARLMSFCLANMAKGSNISIKASHVNGDGKWFSDINNLHGGDNSSDDFTDDIRRVGVEVTGYNDDGRLSCSDKSVAVGQLFMTILRLSSGHEVLCSLGFGLRLDNVQGTFLNSCDEFNSSGGSTIYAYEWPASLTQDGNSSEDAFYTKIQGLAPSLFTSGDTYGSMAQYHLIQRRAFRLACGNSPTGGGSTSGQAIANVKTVSWDSSTLTASDPYDVEYTNDNEWSKNDGRVPLFYDLGGGRDSYERSCAFLFDQVAGEGADAINNALAYQQWLQDNHTEDMTNGVGDADFSGGENSTSTCRVDGIGWLVCPIVNLMATMVDSSYYLLDNTLLRTAPIIIGDDNDSLYSSWKMMRDFANVAFVITFLIIVFSQITSFGVSNYGIKRLFPKLIIAAIMVNISYFICAIAVDLSNILGSSLKSLLDGAANRVAIDPPEGWQQGVSDGSGFAGMVGWAGAATLILGSAGLAGGPIAALALLIPLLFAALGAVIAVVVTLIIRQVLIILLVVLSPLAFVALLLPNTESFFKKWRTLFQSLLLLYPIIALVFGASALASAIIMGASRSTNETSQTLMQLAGAAASVIPLFIVPAVIKVAGGVLNRFAGIVNNPNKGPIDWARNRSMKGVERMQKNQAIDTFSNKPRGRTRDFLSGRSKYRRGANLKRDDVDRDRELALQEADYNARQVLDNTEISQASDREMRAVAGAISIQADLKDKELRAATAVIENANLSGEERQELAKGEAVKKGEQTYQGDVLQKAAALKQFSAGSMGQKLELIEETREGGTLEKYSQEISDAVVKNNLPSAAPQLGGKSIDDIAQNKYDPTQRTLAAIKDEGRFTSDSVSGMNSTAFEKALEIAKGDDDAMSVLKEAANGITANQNHANKIKGNKEMERLLGEVLSWTPSTGKGASATPPTSAQSSGPSTSVVAGSGPGSTPSTPTVPTISEQRSFTRDQIKVMGPQGAQAAVQARGGMTTMNEGDLFSIANEHGAAQVGQDAKAEINRRGITSKTYKARQSPPTYGPPAPSDTAIRPEDV